MASPKVMFYVRNKERLASAGGEERSSEYEVICDSHIVGELRYGPYYFTIWEFDRKEAGEERLLCLRIREAVLPEGQELWRSATKTGLYHGGGIPAELVALACVFLRRTLRLGRLVRMDDSPRMFSQTFGGTPHYLERGEANLGQMGDWLNLVECLKPELHEPFILAARLYQQALELLGSKADLAYLNLVSAIEVLAQDFEITKPSVEEFDPTLGRLLAQVADEGLRQQLASSFLKRERFIQRRFVSFVLAHISADFWTEPGRPTLGLISPEGLPGLLKKVYEQRSRTLHSGEPFPPAITSVEEELPVGLSMSIGERKWDRPDFIPCIPFFERLVNHVLKHFVLKNQCNS